MNHYKIPDVSTLNSFFKSLYHPEHEIELDEDKQDEDIQMRKSIRDLLSKYDGLVMGGNDFLYTKELPSHPCSYFLYQYGDTLVEAGLDTIFLENHYLIELIQTRGLIGHVMYCAYLYGLRVIGLEGKFSPEDYKKYMNKEIESSWKTVAYTTKKRIDRLNIITKDIVDHHKKGKYLLFCGMSHVNDETDVTQCKGIKTLLNVPGCGAIFTEHSKITSNKPFVDNRSGYKRPCDYLIEIHRNLKIDNRLYVCSTYWCLIHDILFFYKSYRNLMKSCIPEKPYSVSLLWKHTTSIYPPLFKDYIEDMIARDKLLSISSSEIDDLCSYIFSTYVVNCKKIPSREELVQAMAPITEEQLFEVIDLWVDWVKKQTDMDTLERTQLDLCSDIIFLEYKKLSLKDDEEYYVSYLKNKFIKQLERPEHKLFNLLRIMKSLHFKFHSHKFIERLLA